MLARGRSRFPAHAPIGQHRRPRTGPTNLCLHRLRGLSALTTETKAEMTDALNVSAVLTSQNDPFQCLADRVHESSLLSFLSD
jgi:hypothetical protein